MEKWYEKPLDQRCPSGGESEFGKYYKGGEFMPFYVPRVAMPQIDAEFYPELLDYLKQRGIGYNYEKTLPLQIRPHQRFEIGRVEKMKQNKEFLEKPVLVSFDKFILDGHHRWEAHVLLHEIVSCLVIKLMFEQAIRTLFGFPKVYTIAEIKEIRN